MHYLKVLALLDALISTRLVWRWTAQVLSIEFERHGLKLRFLGTGLRRLRACLILLIRLILDGSTSAVIEWLIFFGIGHLKMVVT
ncbi:hypothetical protein Goari_021936 [Gossypium aridum]|uniref:Uncharacterized protein n=1 Tax=Gossypium aridum TaxID=34290 RepID=A0A7J8YW79_GOSAI|nr:hypothetical protein [Gossypium aridum]